MSVHQVLCVFAVAVALVFSRTHNCGNGDSLTLLMVLGTLLLLSVCPVQLLCDAFACAVFFFSCMVVVSWTPAVSSGRRRRRGEFGEEERWGAGRGGGRKTAQDVLYKRRIYFQ